MPYFLSSLFVIALATLDVSFVARLFSSLAMPFLVVPFLIIISIRDRTIFPLFLALVAGSIYATATGSIVYLLGFILVTAISKILFSDSRNYNFARATAVLLAISIVMIIAGSYDSVSSSLLSLSLYLELIVFAVGSAILLLVTNRVFKKYFDYVEKYTSERYR